MIPAAVCQHGAVSRVGNEREWRWRIGVASALVGSAGVFAGLRQDLGLGWGLTLVAVTALGAMLALRGVHHRVEAEQARRTVFYAGAGSTAWVMLLMGAAVIPGLALSAIDDAGVRAVVAGLLGAVLAAAAHGILAATTTLEEQPRPEPVPLDRRRR
ncbi:hypothetical protein BX598_1081 [Micrococcaceae bacterium JKS001869]|nr:hypothetical protein BX598_1081 [Micrococcaceae bacterium JKS001869]